MILNAIEHARVLQNRSVFNVKQNKQFLDKCIQWDVPDFTMHSIQKKAFEQFRQQKNQ